MNPQLFLSLKDITSRRATDQAVGLVEEVVNYAPEVERIMGRPIPGTFYDARVRTSLSQSGLFRKANQGVTPGASTYDQRRFNAMFFDSQLQVDEAIARAAEQQGDSLGLLQAEEAEGAIRSKAIYLSKQIYQGTLFDPQGFPGLINFLDTFSTITDSRTGVPIVNVVDAGGNSAACEIVWYIWMHPQGVHFLYGGNQGIDIKPWTFQYVADPNDPSKRLGAWCSNLSGFLGLSCANPFAVYAALNVDNTVTVNAGVPSVASPFTDKLDADLMSLMPVGYAPNLCLMSKRSRFGLQLSRSVTLFGQATNPVTGNSGGAAPLAPVPLTTASGVPIVVTDGILTGGHIVASGA